MRVFINDRREGSKQSAEAFAKRDETIKAVAKESAETSRECAKAIAEAAELSRSHSTEYAGTGARRGASGLNWRGDVQLSHRHSRDDSGSDYENQIQPPEAVAKLL